MQVRPTLPENESKYVTRSGLKLQHALTAFGISPAGWVCADLGSHQGGFVDCLLQHGAAKVYSVDTSYGTLAWKLRQDPHVVVMERTNAMHVTLPEPVDLVTIDVGWTCQRFVLPAARRLLKDAGRIISLVKPQYEAGENERQDGVVPEENLEPVLARVRVDVQMAGLESLGETRSPLKGGGGNVELFLLLAPASPPSRP
jgi:23S rRNA (cytidine1920-2'-O)/16S rRNA (cytidine1409-2'-O)-methyltransferase